MFCVSRPVAVLSTYFVLQSSLAWAAPPPPANAQPAVEAPADPVVPATPAGAGSEELVEHPVTDRDVVFSSNNVSGGPFAFLSSAPRSSALLGDMWGFRPFISQYGATLSLQETSEVLGNVTGGIRRGFAYEGLTTATLQVDTQRAFGLYGGLFNTSGLQIHGRNLSAEDLGTLQTASGIEADRATRLWELWYQQKLLDDRIDVRIGQQSADQEFMVSANALYFVNTMFGWPMLPSADLPGGGPAYPLSAPAVRLRAHITDAVTGLVGVFSGSPAPNDTGDPQQQNPSGTSFPLNKGALVIAELQYGYPSAGTLIQADETEPLARTYKLGMWYDTEKFFDLRTGTDGLSLANPLSNGIAASHRGNFAIYGVADQMIYRWYDDPDRNINVFIRPMLTPLQDRNLISFSLNAGLTMHEPFFGRDDDTFGLGMGVAKVSRGASGLDADNALFGTAVFTPVRHTETFIEATYQYQVMPWWQIQPDIQFTFNPGGGIANPLIPTERVKNELVTGIRTNVTF